MGAALALALFSSSVQAQSSGTTWFGDTADGQMMVGIKVGDVRIDDPLYENANNATLVLGYQFARVVGNRASASVEFEIGDSFNEGDLNISPPGNWKARTIGLYMAVRTPGTVYFKGKLGVLDSDIRTRDTGQFILDQGDTAFAFGAGFGVLLGAEKNFNLELEWTGASGDNDIQQFTLGGLARF